MPVAYVLHRPPGTRPAPIEASAKNRRACTRGQKIAAKAAAPGASAPQAELFIMPPSFCCDLAAAIRATKRKK